MYFITTKSLLKPVTVLSLLILMFVANVFAQNSRAFTKGLARGQEAINKLSDRLPEVAVRYGKSPGNLRRLLLDDPTLNVDDQDRLLYVDTATEQAESYKTDAQEITQAGPFPNSQTFSLHSKPGSSRVIYLDFDGYVTTNTGWNTSYTSGQPINSAPFSIDGDPSTFNQQEQDVIQYVWQRVAEDYAPFDVDVTTQDPGDAAIFRSSSSDLQYGARAVISPTNFTGSNIGGIAYVGVFNYSGTSYKPAFIMSSALGNSEKNIAEAVSHEVGHNLGLDHDGTPSTGYYSGHADWAPIMGVGYYRNVTQWSKGEYPNANQLQDDLAIMQSYGIPVLADDHANNNSSATALSGTSISASGIITNRDDVDVFKFSTGGGNVTININPAPRGGNLDILAKITDEQGNVIATSNPTGLAASFNQFLSSGTYYLSVDGTGTGDLTTGYSDYASIGQYNITGTLVTSNAQPPIADVSAFPTSGTAPLIVTFSSANSTGSIVSWNWNFGDGTSSTVPNPSHTYNSAGTFTATLTITDSNALTASKSIVITASSQQPAPNQPPVAAVSVNTTSGYAPLAINFNGTGSYDPDGGISSYAWDFGDGYTSTTANTSHTYGNPGNYIATLTVTDINGATNSKSVTINVQQQVSTGNTVYVKGITMVLAWTMRGTAASAIVTVYDSSGKPRPNATVTGRWSGLVSGYVTGVTDLNGQVILTSSGSLKRGTFTFNITDISSQGYTYNPLQNAVSSGSIRY